MITISSNINSWKGYVFHKIAEGCVCFVMLNQKHDVTVLHARICFPLVIFTVSHEKVSWNKTAVA
jgi:hypothetical protein